MSERPWAVVQFIETTWTKASRSGDGAARRNALPAGLVWPQGDAPPALPTPSQGAAAPARVLLHRVGFGEADGFVARETATWGTLRDLDAALPGLTLRVHEGSLQLGFAWTWGVGAPERNSQPLFRVKPGAWGQVVFNGRFGSSMAGAGFEHFYRQYTYNVGVAVEAADVFVSTEPVRREILLVPLA